MLVEDLHDPGEVEQGPGQAVDLVDDHAVDPPRLDVGHEPLQRRPVHVAAGEAAVVVGVGQADPALVLLARDVRLGGLPLGVEGVELLVEALLGGLAGVDGAAGRAWAWSRQPAPYWIENGGSSRRLPCRSARRRATHSSASPSPPSPPPSATGRPLPSYSKPSSSTVTAMVRPRYSRVSTAPGMGRRRSCVGVNDPTTVRPTPVFGATSRRSDSLASSSARRRARSDSPPCSFACSRHAMRLRRKSLCRDVVGSPKACCVRLPQLRDGHVPERLDLLGERLLHDAASIGPDSPSVNPHKGIGPPEQSRGFSVNGSGLEAQVACCQDRGHLAQPLLRRHLLGVVQEVHASSVTRRCFRCSWGLRSGGWERKRRRGSVAFATPTTPSALRPGRCLVICLIAVRSPPEFSFYTCTDAPSTTNFPTRRDHRADDREVHGGEPINSRTLATTRAIRRRIVRGTPVRHLLERYVFIIWNIVLGWRGQEGRAVIEHNSWIPWVRLVLERDSERSLPGRRIRPDDQDNSLT